MIYFSKLGMPLVFIVLFLGWVLYRLFIKKDLKNNLDSFYIGMFFIVLWGVIYWWFFH